MKYLLISLLFTATIFSQINYDDYFLNNSLRIDYYRTGTSTSDLYSLKELIQEKYFSGSKTNLIDTLNYGFNKVMVFDESENKLIFSRNYSSLFLEWQKTTEAETSTKSFEESISIPFPKKKVRVEFHLRNNKNEFEKKYSINIDPNDYFIRPQMDYEFRIDSIYYSNEINKAYDIVFLPDGYTENDSNLFKEDCKRFSEYLFKYKPYSDMKNNINIWSVNAYSKENGADIPGKDIWKNTILNSTFYTFDSERYLMTYNFHQVKNVASNAPYDQIVILVNSEKYGGGAIYNFYSTFVSRNNSGEKVFIHELGHGVAALADEYVDTETFNNFYDLSLEPYEENITTLVNFDSKWKSEVSPSTPIPTPLTKDFNDKIGAFEGAGYVAKGIYRPYQNCIMRKLANQEYCSVCEKAVKKILDFYSH